VGRSIKLREDGGKQYFNGSNATTQALLHVDQVPEGQRALSSRTWGAMGQSRVRSYTPNQVDLEKCV
jgi:hypothetical protein